MFDHFNNQAPPPEPPPPKKVLRFDKGYLKSLPGILQLSQFICNLVGFICIKVSWSWLSAIFYNLVYWIGNIITIFLLLSYTFHVVEKYDRWPWPKYEFLFCGAMSLAYIVCSIFAAVVGESVGIAVAVFGICAMVAYALDAYFKYKAWKRGLPPQ